MIDWAAEERDREQWLAGLRSRYRIITAEHPEWVPPVETELDRLARAPVPDHAEVQARVVAHVNEQLRAAGLGNVQLEADASFLDIQQCYCMAIWAQVLQDSG